MTYIILAAIFLIATISFLSCKTLFVPQYEGETSDHFDGKRFFNPEGNAMGSFSKLMKYQISNKKEKWYYVEGNDANAEIKAYEDSGIRYKQINHATILVQHNNVNILTDPVYSKRASPFSWSGPKRHREPAIPFEKLPKIDIVVISHDHYDHLDIQTLKRLSDEHQPLILVGLGTKAFLEKFDIKNVQDMDWDEVQNYKGIDITFLPCKHWSNRFAAPYKTLWGSWFFQSESKGIYYAGDTGFSDHFQQVKDKFPTIDLALIPIGAYVPRFFMQHVHMAPEDAIKAHEVLQPKESLAIHWGTFQLTGEGMFDPVDELQVIMNDKNIDNFYYDRDHNKYYLQD